MQLSRIQGQERVVHALQRSIRTNRVAHAYLFEGPDGCGRRTTALALIQTLFCGALQEGDACGVCSACRKLASGNHPDLQQLAPLPDKRDISIDQIRELQQMLALRPFEATRKACLIEPAERMNEKSANALLKTLEEPPGNAVMILLTTQADLLPATIRSRCQHLRFSPLADHIVTALLQQQGMEATAAAQLGPLAEGSMERARLLEAEDDTARRAELLAVLAQTSHNRIAAVFDAAESLAGTRDETLTTLDQLISLLRDQALLQAAGTAVVTNRFLQTELTAEARRFTPAATVEALELALSVRRAVQGNANPKLALEHLLLGYDRLRTKGV